MTIPMNSGINDPSYFEDNWLKEECENNELEVIDVPEVNAEYFDIKVKIMSVNHKGLTHKQRYFKSGVVRDSEGNVTSKGQYWKARELMISCGEYVMRPNDKGELKQHVKEPFEERELVGKRFIGNFKHHFNKNKGRAYLQLENERERPEGGVSEPEPPLTFKKPIPSIGEFSCAKDFNQQVNETSGNIPF